MKVSLEPITWILRIHPEGDYGDPYVGSATVTVDDDRRACLRALTGTFNRETWTAIEAALKTIGVKTVLFTRRHNSRSRPVTVDIL